MPRGNRVAATNSSLPSPAQCWQCGAPAQADCAYRIALVAPSRRHLDALGFPAIRRWTQDSVRVPVPRCAACRNRTRAGIAVVFGLTGLAAAAGTFLQTGFWPHAEAPSWLHYEHEGYGNAGTGIGLVLGFVLALGGLSWPWAACPGATGASASAR